MRDDRHAQTARRFEIYEQCQALEADLLKIPGVVSVEFDLDGFYDHMNQVIFLAGYKITAKGADYFREFRAMKLAIIQTAMAHDLTSTGDAIEDYGEHLYFVRRCGETWTRKGAGPC